MGFRAVTLFLSPLLAMTLGAQGVQLPEVVARTLGNGMQVLLVERPGAAVHAELFVQGGRANTGGLPAGVADLLTRSLFRQLLPEEAERGLKLALAQEAAALQGLHQARLLGLAGAGRLAELEANHAQALSALQEQLRPLEDWDALDALGATRRELHVEADYLSHAVELPVGTLLDWCQLEAARLKRLPGGRFPLERERLLREIEAGTPPSAPALALLLATAMAGQPYALVGSFQRSQLADLSWETLKPYMAGLLVPERMTLVLVGGIQAQSLLPALERSFGRLGAGGGRAPAEPYRSLPEEIQSGPDAPGDRRLTVSTLGQPRLFFSWRVPPANHPDGVALRTLAQVLGVSPSSRLQQRLTGPRGVARKVSLSLGVPGGRDGNLLVIEAEPAEGRSLEELEQAVHGEILRITREPLPDHELHRAQVEQESRELLLQEDAGTLAHALGSAWCQGGDWKLAFQALQQGRDLKPAEIQGVARTYLIPARATIAQMGPDPLLVPMDRTESRLLQVLSALVQRKLGGEAQAQNVLREAMRQVRMLSAAEREHTLKLLEAQVRP